MAPDVIGLPAPVSPAPRRTRRAVTAAAVFGVVAVTALVWAVLGAPTPHDPATEAEARAYLDKAIRAGLARDFRALCDLNGSVFNCETDLDSRDRATVPTAAPTSIEAFYAKAKGGNETPGWVLTVQGRNGQGLPYKTEVMVFKDHEGKLTAINIVWWSGNRIVLDGGEVQTPDFVPAS